MKSSIVWKRAAVSEDGKPALVASALQIGKVGKQKSSHLVVGTQQGSVEMLSLFERETGELIECQGSAVTQLDLCDVCSLNMTDMVVGDSAGNVHTYSAGIRIATHFAGNAVTSLLMNRDLYGNPTLIVGDSSGSLSSFIPLVSEEKDFKISLKPFTESQNEEWSIQQLISYNSTPSATKLLSHYTVVVTRSPTLRFYSGASCVFFIPFPCNIRAVCKGYFKQMESGDSSQLAVALDDGRVFLVADFSPSFWFQSDYVLTSLASCNLGARESQEKDFLVAAGHFNGVVAFSEEGTQLWMHETSDWVHLLVSSRLVPPEGSFIPDKEFIALATVDNTIEVLEFSND